MIIITGSGRSGTSIVTKLFHLCGKDIDGADNWTSDVRAGFEHPEIVAINKLIFEIIQKHECYGTSWINPTEANNIAKIMKTVLQHFSKKMKGKVIKDPLFSKTLPIWIAADCEIERVIVCERNPWIAAKSANETGRGFSPVTRYDLNQIAVEFMARIQHLKHCETQYKIPFNYIRYENLAKDFKSLMSVLPDYNEEQIDEVLKDNIKMSKRQ